MSAPDLYTEVGPSVVQVLSLSIIPCLVRDRVSPRLGTGFVIAVGQIVTNRHVVAALGEKGHVSRPCGQMVTRPILQMLGAPP